MLKFVALKPLIIIIVIKAGPTWWVGLGPSRPGGWTGRGKTKDQDEQKPSWPMTRATKQNPVKTRFFFQMYFFS
jgi:hypothetical protein